MWDVALFADSRVIESPVDNEFEVNMRTKRISVKRFCEECLEVFDEVYETGYKYMPDWQPPKKRKAKRKKTKH